MDYFDAPGLGQAVTNTTYGPLPSLELFHSNCLGGMPSWSSSPLLGVWSV